MTVTVQFSVPLQQLWGASSLNISLPPGSTIAALLEELGRLGYAIQRMTDEYCWRHGSTSVIVLLRGCPVSPEEAGNSVLADGDTVILVPPLAGGDS